MSAILENPVLMNIFWILVGAVIARILDEPIERFQRRINYWSNSVISRFRGSGGLSVRQNEFRIGKWQTGWVIIEGSSSDPYTSSNVVCQIDPTPIALPPDLQQRMNAIEEQQAELEKGGKPREFHNGPITALASIGRGQLGYTEEPFLILRLRPTDYYTYLATTMSLDLKTQTEQGRETTIRDKYLCNLRYEVPIPEFAGGFGVNLSVITSDGFIIVAKRAMEGIAPYPGYICAAINECMNPILDRNVNGALSLVVTAQRGANYELNIEITEDEVSFFTLGVDPQNYQYVISGLIRSKSFSRDDIISRRSIGSKERWETQQLNFLPHDLDKIAKFLQDTSRTEKWIPTGFACLVQTLMSEFGIRKTEQALRKYPPLKK